MERRTAVLGRPSHMRGYPRGQVWDGDAASDARHAADLTAAEVAEALAIHPATVSRWERGASPPHSILPRIARLLGVRPGDLLVRTRRRAR